jgi:gliding motility-associated-like protein
MFKNILGLLMLLPFVSNAQTWRDVTNDYITNPSFEIYDACPTAVSTPNDYQINHCTGWTTPTYATSDYYNSCNSGGVGVPNNAAGYQNAYNGNGYLGFHAYAHPSDSAWCEYVQSNLLRPLNAGKQYRFSMRINFSKQWSVCASQIGAHFSSANMQNYSTTLPYNIEPTVMNSSGFICDTTEWRVIAGEFTALGNEQFITIGWFEEDYLNDYQLTPPIYVDSASGDTMFIPENYYFVDSLKLYELTYDISEFQINLLTPNGDLINDAFDFTDYGLNELHFVVYNRWGNIVFMSESSDLIWQGTSTTGEPLSSGTYFYMINATLSDGNKIIRYNYVSILIP